MKLIFPFFASLIMLTACNQQHAANQALLKNNVDTLQAQIKSTYKPGLGEFMLDLQIHHSKLWYAGQAQNWKLADYEVGQIEGTVGDIKQYHAEMPEIKPIDIISPAIDSLKSAIQAKNEPQFTRSFTLLTNNCNNCHVATKYQMNVITVPDAVPVSNQKFGL